MAQPLIDLVEQFCTFQRKQRGKTEGGVKTYRWNLRQYLEFIAGRRGRPACVGDLEPATVQAWMDSMAAADLALGTMRVRQSTLSSLCAFLVKRGHLDTNPVARLDRPPHRREAPRQVPGSAIMDALVKAAQQRRRPRDLAIFLILRYSATPACGGSRWPRCESATSTAAGASAACP
jgi:site-specific recombinase XerC